MRVIKKVNNNAAICIDSLGNEVIAIGTGIGFPSVPYDLNDLSIIERTYYDVDPMYLDLLNQIPKEIFSISTKIVDMFRNQVDPSVSSNIVFTLADHINFAIERQKKNIQFENKLQYEIQHLYEKEYNIGLEALKIVQKEMNVRLPRVEASSIALQFINAKSVATVATKTSSFEEILEEVIEMIGQHFNVFINKKSVSYSRFVSHFRYLMKGEHTNKQVSSENFRMFKSVVDAYPKTYQVVQKISDYLKDELEIEINNEEQIYLILHVNRLCVREDCNRKGITPAQDEN